MAIRDYRTCDVCGRKTFYDANLNYGYGDGPPPRACGEPWDIGADLDHLGDWAVLCRDCAETHRTQIVPIEGSVE